MRLIERAGLTVHAQYHDHSELVLLLCGRGAVEPTVEEPLGPGINPSSRPRPLHSTHVWGVRGSTLPGWPYEYSAGYLGDNRMMKTVITRFFVRNNRRNPQAPRLLIGTVNIFKILSPASCGSFREGSRHQLTRSPDRRGGWR